MRLSGLRQLLLHHLDPVDARMIIRLATGLDDIHQITESGMELSKKEEEEALRLMERRLKGTPMAYITGEKEFYGHSFKVSPSVLIPRPDTETLVEEALAASSLFPSPAILDLCTGSGAIASSIAYALKKPVAFSDISEEALAIAKENYRRITGEEPDARCGSLFAPWKGHLFDIIVSNPPYLTDSWYQETDKDVKAEPLLAFIGGGEDGLSLIRSIISSSPLFLNEGGFLMLECDYRQTGICGSLLEKSGFTDIRIVKDMAGKERVVYGRRFSE